MTQIDEPNLDEQIRSALRIAKHIAETGGDGLEERQVDELKALIATQIQEAYRKGYIDGGIGVINGELPFKRQFVSKEELANELGE